MRITKVLLVLLLAWPCLAGDKFVDGTMPAFEGMNSFAQAGGADTITLDALCDATEADIDNCGITLLSGLRAGQQRRITAYNAETKIATVHSNWTGGAPDGTTMYIITVGYDGNAGTSAGIGNAWASITKAGDSATSGDVVKLAAGTHYEPAVNVAGNNGRVTFSAASTGKDLVFQPDTGAAGQVTVSLFDHGANAYGISFAATHLAGAVTFNDIDFETTNTSATFVLVAALDANSTSAITFSNCTLTNGPNSTRQMLYWVGTTGVSRDLTLTNVVLSTAKGSWLDVYGLDTLTMTGCTATHSASDVPDNPLINLLPSAGTMHASITGNTITSECASATVPVISSAVAAGSLRIANNTITHSGTAIWVKATAGGTLSPVMTGNTLNATSGATAFYSIMLSDEGVDVSDQSIVAPLVESNTITVTGDGAGAVLGIQLGPECKGGTVRHNTLISTQVNRVAVGIYNRNADYSLIDHNSVVWNVPIAIIEGDYVRVTHNSTFTATQTSHGGITIRDSNKTRLGVDTAGISLTGAAWADATKTITKVGAFAGYTRAAGDKFVLTAGTGATPGEYAIDSNTNDTIVLGSDINGAGADIADASVAGRVGSLSYDPKHLTVESNIFGSAASKALCIWSHVSARAMVKLGWRIDRNLYWATGTAELAQIDGTDYATAAALAAYWTALTATTDAGTSLTDSTTLRSVQLNDANSEAANPRFMSATDLRPQRSSPAIRGVSEFWNTWGAWQTVPRTRNSIRYGE